MPYGATLYMPPSHADFLRVYSEWEREKVRRLEARGLAVEVLDPDAAKKIPGTEVRGSLRRGSAWEHLVPAAAAGIIRRVVADHPERAGLRS